MLCCVYLVTFSFCFVSSVVMDAFTETAVFFENAENTLHNISDKVCHGSDVPTRQYISVLKDSLTRITELKV